MPRAWMMMAALALAVLPAEAAAACLRYDAPEQLTGTLTRRPVPGARGPQVYWYLRLDRPACIDAKPGSAGLDAARDSLRDIQLELPHDVHARVAAQPDMRVVAVGTLFGANPGPHATPVMMRVRALFRGDAR